MRLESSKMWLKMGITRNEEKRGKKWVRAELKKSVWYQSGNTAGIELKFKPWTARIIRYIMLNECKGENQGREREWRTRKVAPVCTRSCLIAGRIAEEMGRNGVLHVNSKITTDRAVQCWKWSWKCDAWDNCSYETNQQWGINGGEWITDRGRRNGARWSEIF